VSNTKPNPAELDFSAVTWEKSPFSGDNDNCVESGAIGDLVALGDSNRPSGPSLTPAETGFSARRSQEAPATFTPTEVAAIDAHADALHSGALGQ
jgi:hypothetical protein